MKEILEIVFRSFWTWCGALLLSYTILYMVLNGLAHIINRFIRRQNIKQHGYPPKHCDADGDFLVKEEAT